MKHFFVSACYIALVYRFRRHVLCRAGQSKSPFVCDRHDLLVAKIQSRVDKTKAMVPQSFRNFSAAFCPLVPASASCIEVPIVVLVQLMNLKHGGN
jgi:hypothetical protein